MIKAIKKILVNILTGANLVTVGLLLLSGYSDRFPPADIGWLACAGMILPFFVVVNLLFVVIWVLFCWRRLWIPLLGFALAYVPIRIYMPLHASQDPPEGALKVVSWNVAGYGGNFKYEAAFDSVLSFLQREKADIVCLQEDMGPRFRMDRIKEYYPYSDTTGISTSKKFPNMVGIHSRFPILRKEVIDYTSQTNGSVAYYLLVGRDTVIVINNHLESTHLSLEDRERYADMLKGGMERDTAQAETRFLIDKLSGSMAKRAPAADSVSNYVERHRQYPIIVCGDFNDTPISYARHTVSHGLTDCFVETGRGFGVSFNRKGFSFRIDHMMVSSHFTPYGCKIDSKIDVSDHYPLLCWLKMADNP